MGRAFRSRLAVALLIVGATSPLPGWALSEHIEPEDLVYRGAFRLPREFDWGARGMSFLPSGDGARGSLLISGRDDAVGEWAEVSIPAPALGHWESWPEAELLTAMRVFDGSLIEDHTGASETWVGGIECLEPRGEQTTRKCYWSANWWYNVGGEQYAVVGMSEVDGSRPRGMWHVGPSTPEFHSSRHGQYMFAVPSWFAEQALEGREMLVGMHRTAGAFGASQGPTLYAFRPWTSESPGEGRLDAQALVYYREKYPDCAGPDEGDPARCDFPDYRAADRWEGGAFLEAGPRSVVVLVGVKATGSNFYGESRPGDCSPYQGYHGDPYEARFLFYTLDDLASSASGRTRPWKVLPSRSWRPPPFRETCPDVGGAAADRRSGTLFVVEKGYGDSTGDNVSVVHVWSFPAGSPPGDSAKVE